MAERILIIAPSWVGDAILSEPLVAVLREPFEEPIVDVLAPPWAGPVYARMRGIRRRPFWALMSPASSRASDQALPASSQATQSME